MRGEPIRRVACHEASDRMGVEKRITELRFQSAKRQKNCATVAGHSSDHQTDGAVLCPEKRNCQRLARRNFFSRR